MLILSVFLGAFYFSDELLTSLLNQKLPFAGLSPILTVLAWSMMLVMLGFTFTFDMYLIPTLFCCCAFVLQIMSHVIELEKNVLHQDLSSTLLFSVHALVISLAISSIALGMMAGVLHFLESKALKQKKLTKMISFFPSLEVADRLTVRSVWFGFICLSIGLVTGVYLAHVFWKDAWYLDRKFLFALGTWFWHLSVLMVRKMYGYRGKRFLLLNSIGFVLIILVFSFSLFLQRTP